jgi:demethylmenaquinone methyltransferase/2-methoxy-6-polyprenyl-1,4-benzoquinol methylase
MIDLGPGSRILDVATGTGAQAFAFADNAGEVVGIDLSEAMLRIARRQNRFPNVTFQQADAAELPFDDETFNASCVSFALHEMPISIRERVIREMARVTKPGGSVTVVDYGLPRNRVASSLVFHIVKLYERDHYASFVRSDLNAFLLNAGVDPSEHRPALRGLAKILTGRRSEAVARTTSSVLDPDRVP